VRFVSSTVSSGSATRRRLLLSPRAIRRLVGLALGLGLCSLLLLFAGRLVVEADPLVHADAIFVLGGTRLERALEAADLFREGFAPLIVISGGAPEPAEESLGAMGISVPSEAEVARNILVRRLGLPAAAIEVLNQPLDNTAQEAAAISTEAHARGWTRLIVITDRAATRRAAYALRRVLGSQVQVVARASRRDDYDPARWWATRDGIRETFYELPKLVAYWLGLRG
jgi:uncharacterized SAM-binding protein YcdF (DUF218 family)